MNTCIISGSYTGCAVNGKKYKEGNLNVIIKLCVTDINVLTAHLLYYIHITIKQIKNNFPNKTL